ncbi:MAG: metal ABC transporter permease [Anaerolineales bacterium]|nr:MAG: metal ABC transporter permease [Anaerolineales bacterium]
MSPQIQIQLIAAIVAAASALLGVFLVLRRMSLMSDAISHSILLGIVIGFFVAGTTDSPLLILTATLAGVLTVVLVELLLQTRLFKEDAAIGLVFPVLFSIGVILISTQARDVHIDTDAVLLGELAFAPFNRVSILGLDLPRGLAVMSVILLLNLILVSTFYKELKIATFDPALAAALGISPLILHYGLMTAVSVTAVGAFDHVGAILVVALMIAPASTAYLLTDRLGHMLILSVGIGVASAISGYWVARAIDINIAATMASMTGVFFLLAFLFAPQQGYVARQFLRRRRRERFAIEILLVHLCRHEGSPDESHENTLRHLTDELNWKPKFADDTLRRAESSHWVERRAELLVPTADGRNLAQEVLSR